MRTYCLSCKKHSRNSSPQGIKMTNKVIRQASKCDVCVANKSKFLKQKPIGTKDPIGTKAPKSLVLRAEQSAIRKHVVLLFEVQK